jgi:hypothetical protein
MKIATLDGCSVRATQRKGINGPKLTSPNLLKRQESPLELNRNFDISA